VKMFLLVVNTLSSSRREIITVPYNEVDHAYILRSPKIWKLLTIKRKI